jgi:hypothetical protein
VTIVRGGKPRIACKKGRCDGLGVRYNPPNPITPSCHPRKQLSSDLMDKDALPDQARIKASSAQCSQRILAGKLRAGDR